MSMKTIDVKLPVLPQTKYCRVTGFDMATANNYVARKIIVPDEVGERQVKGTRLFSISTAFRGRIIAELVQHHKIPPSDAAQIAMLASKGGWIEILGAGNRSQP